MPSQHEEKTTKIVIDGKNAFSYSFGVPLFLVYSYTWCRFFAETEIICFFFTFFFNIQFRHTKKILQLFIDFILIVNWMKFEILIGINLKRNFYFYVSFVWMSLTFLCIATQQRNCVGQRALFFLFIFLIVFIYVAWHWEGSNYASKSLHRFFSCMSDLGKSEFYVWKKINMYKSWKGNSLSKQSFIVEWSYWKF